MHSCDWRSLAKAKDLLHLHLRPRIHFDGLRPEGAWDFERINRRHARHLKILGGRPGGALRNDTAAKALLRWAAEREVWLDAVINDPLLPGRILPSDYLGQQAWRRRVEVLRDTSQQLRTFHPA